MLAELSFNDITTAYAAFLSTSVFAFQIYKWRCAGPQVQFEVQTRRFIVNSPTVSEKKTVTCFAVTNTGDQATTITNVGFRYYEKPLSRRFCKKPTASAIVANTCFKPLPHELQPGTIWNGVMDELMATEDYRRKGLFVFEVYCSHQKKPIINKVRYACDKELAMASNESASSVL